MFHRKRGLFLFFISQSNGARFTEQVCSGRGECNEWHTWLLCQVGLREATPGAPTPGVKIQNGGGFPSWSNSFVYSLVFTASVVKFVARRSGNALCRINEVTLRRARLVLGWVTVYGQVNHLGTKPASYVESAFYPSWDGKLNISFRAE